MKAIIKKISLIIVTLVVIVPIIAIVALISCAFALAHVFYKACRDMKDIIEANFKNKEQSKLTTNGE